MREFREWMGCVLILGAVCAGGARAASPGDVVITEIMQNPAAVSDANGEWIELYNSTGAPIDLEGWTIGDGAAESHTIQAGGSGVIPASGFFVMGRFSDVTQNGGVALDYPYASVTLGNGADAVVLRESGVTIDSVGYDDGVTFPDPSGASMELVDPAADNTVGGNWEENVTDPYGAGDYGTPGAANHAWGAIGGPPAISLVAHFPLFPSSFDSVAVNAQIVDDGSITVASLYYRVGGGAFQIVPMTPVGGDFFEAWVPPLFDGDVVEYYVCATDDESLVSYDPSDAPGTTHGYSVQDALPAIAINEVTADPFDDVNEDGVDHSYEDEFIEIYNAGAVTVDISGWLLSDDDSPGAEFAFPAGTSIAPGEFITLFGGGAPTIFPGQVFTDDGRIGNGLSNTGDTVTLVRAGVLIDEFTWGTEGNMNESMIRVPDGTGPWTRPSQEGRPWSFSPQATNGGGSTRTSQTSWSAVKSLFLD